MEHIRKLLLDHDLIDTAEVKKIEKVGVWLLPDKAAALHGAVLVQVQEQSRAVCCVTVLHSYAY